MTDIGPNFREQTERTPAQANQPAAPTSEAQKLPADAVVIVSVRNTLLFPTVVMPLSVGRPRSVAAVQYAVRAQAPIGVLLQRDPEMADPGPAAR
jgi:ATP-dependent Lon protease